MHDGRRLGEILIEFCTRRENFAQIDTFEERGEEKLHFPQDSIRLMLEMGKVDLLAEIYFKIGCVTFLLAVLKDTRPTIYVMILSVTQGSGSEFRPITRPDSESRLHRMRPYRLGAWRCETDQLSHKVKSLPLPHGGVEVCRLPPLSPIPCRPMPILDLEEEKRGDILS